MKYRMLIAFALLAFLSCQKENNSPIQEPPVDSIPQLPKLLKREVSYTKNKPQLKWVKLFTYDDSKRCTEVSVGVIDSAVTTPSFNLQRKLTFLYDESSSRMPSSVSSWRKSLPNFTDTYYHTYNNLGHKIKDSVSVKNTSGEIGSFVIHYEYGSDKVSGRPVLTGFPMENSSLDTIYFTEAGNIERQATRHLSAGGDEFYSYIFTYDQGVNPYNKLNIENSLYFQHPSIGIGYNVPFETHYIGFNTNNMTSFKTGTLLVTFKYVYDEDQYPIRKEMFRPSDTVNPEEVILFEY
jgi:hypothetical protein